MLYCSNYKVTLLPFWSIIRTEVRFLKYTKVILIPFHNKQLLVTSSVADRARLSYVIFSSPQLGVNNRARVRTQVF